VILELFAHSAGYLTKFLNGKVNSLRDIPVETSGAEKGASNRMMKTAIRLDIARKGRL
jgi:hypothetical protein